MAHDYLHAGLRPGLSRDHAFEVHVAVAYVMPYLHSFDFDLLDKLLVVCVERIQREHLVVVDVIPVGAKAFSIRMVQSNIPVRKYDQWVNNLSREIVLQASR